MSKFILLSISTLLFAQDLPLQELPTSSFERVEVISQPESATFMPELIQKKTKSPNTAAVLSALVPGLGHYYLGEYQTANELLGGALIGGVVLQASNDSNINECTLYSLQAVSLYGIFSAYRDACLYNGAVDPKLPRETFANLASAPFQWSVLKKPEVWAGYLGSLALATTVVYFGYSDMHVAMKVNTRQLVPFGAIPIAIGEESLFRGFLQSGVLNRLPAWGAITLSSIAFGAAHIPNALVLDPADQSRYYKFSLPLITTLGAYMGWLTYKNNSLKESVALHAWYDFTLMGLELLATQAAIKGEPTHFSYSFKF